MKEKALMKKLLELVNYKPYVSGKAFYLFAAEELSLEDEQHYNYMVKWTDRGWWEYGVSLRTGWFTPEGIEAIQKILRIRRGKLYWNGNEWVNKIRRVE